MKLKTLWYQILCTSFLLFSVTACKTDGLKDASVPVEADVITPLTATELCALYEVYKNLVYLNKIKPLSFREKRMQDRSFTQLRG